MTRAAREPLPAPSNAAIDVGRLVASMGDTAQSYKFLFLRALVDQLVESPDTFVAYPLLAVRMAEAAWWPARRYRLRTGNEDLLGKAVWRLPPSKSTGVRLRAEIAAHLPDQRVGGFLRYVPQRLLVPWFAGRLRGVVDVDALISARSMALRDELSLPFGQTEDGVDVLPAWRDYLVENAAVLQGWLELQWIDWLQRRNPLVPVTRRKLAPPPSRGSLAGQRAIFQAAFDAMRVAGETPRCIFTGAPLSFPTSPLDHFLPWSFVAHDGIWNLVPIRDAGLNSEKSDRIPGDDAVGPLAAFHRRVVASIDSGSVVGAAALADYGFGLMLEPHRVRAEGALESAYMRTLPPLLATARSMGFGELTGPAI